MKTTIKFRVRYQETDRMGVVHHSVYYIWYEMGRTEWLRERGLSYTECEAQGWLLPVVESGTKYLHSATYDDELEVQTIYRPNKGITFEFEYIVRNLADGVVLATGFTKHVCVNRQAKVDKMATRQLRAKLG
ncbi:MAG: thioesterase family protein [Bacillota bacterium]|jgi:acyl-CoA thioester hydrolase